MKRHSGKLRLTAVRAARIATVVAVACGAYLLGLYSYPRNLWPIPALRTFAGKVNPPAGTYDGFGRLVGHPSKTKVDCPRQSEDTAVLLAIGQSNVANHAAARVVSRNPDAVFNYFDGHCYTASSPLLGATGEEGEFLTLLADKLISDGVYKVVVIASSGISGSVISRWQRDGDLNAMLAATLQDISNRYRVTEVVWHQGESDFKNATSARNYETSFSSLVDTLVENGVQAPVFVAIATRCTAVWRDDNPTARGQRAILEKKGVYLGANTDALVGDDARRSDGCHLGQDGQVRTAASYAEAIKNVRASIGR
ncbi:MAG: sialate O-acetylesterase [Reyranella sp.]|jgi:lysophospholipase L1-like esterase|nr:sialate O-acetylesterase [Reyranella sp.]